MPELQFRAIEFRAADVQGDAVPCTVSSEEPVERGEYLEVLSHDPAHLDLRRAPLPLIVQHDTRQLNVGVVEQLRVEGRKLRGLARFGTSELAQQILKDVKAGIVRNLSVGYRLLDPIKETGRTVYFAWQPYEASLVSVPADTQAGFFRSLKGHQMNDITVTENDTLHLSRSQRRATSQGIEVERERMREITAMGRQHNMQDLADRAIEDGTSVDAFRAQVLARVKPATSLRPAESPDIGLNQREIERYSLARAILCLGDPAYAMREGSFEMECSRATADRLQKDAKGILIPAEVLSASHQRDLVVGTASAGGNLVGTDHLGAAFVSLLRERSLAMELGATLLADLHGNLAVPTQTGTATAYWLNEGSAPTESQAVFGQITLTPKTVGAFTDFSRRLLLQSSPDIESLIRSDLAAVLGQALDAAVFNGSGTGAEPLGVMNQSGIGSVAIGTNGGALTWDHLLQLEEALHMTLANGGSSGLAYVTTPAVRRKAKGTLKVSGDAGTGWMWENGTQEGYGSMNGYRAGASTHIPSNLTKGTGTNLSALLMGLWSDVLIGMWGGLDIMLDPYTLSTSGGKRVVALLDCDVAVRRVASFAVCKDIVTS
ncbi:MAG: phage major capsid protein [Pseudomonadota bacterium]